MINQQGICLDGHMGSEGYGPETWVSVMMKRRCPEFLKDWHAEHCLFGLHLMAQPEYAKAPIGIVESERMAVVLSEIKPEFLWMAGMYRANLTVERFSPLKGRRVFLFLERDESLSNLVMGKEIVGIVKRIFHIDMGVREIDFPKILLEHSLSKLFNF
jgi:hypothetical protein